MLWVLGSVAALFLLVGGVVLSRSSVFRARSIEVTGTSSLSRAEVLQEAGLTRATNVPWLDEAAVEHRLEDLTWVDRATVQTSLPWTIQVEISERVPVAVANDGVRELLVAGDGTILGDASRSDRRLPRIELPVAGTVEGVPPTATGAARILAAMGPERRSEVTRVAVLMGGTLELRLREGLRVRLGDATEPLRKVQALERVLAWAEAEGERLAVVTVTSPWAPAATFARR